MITSNAGMLSIGLDKYKDWTRAFSLSQQGKIFKYNPMTPEGQIPVGVTGITPEIRNRLSQSADLLLYLRIGNVVLPGIPKVEINKLADRIERQLEYTFDAVMTNQDGNPLDDYNINNIPEDKVEKPSPRRENVLDKKSLDVFN